MNLHGVVRGAITAINPDETVTYQISTGYSTGRAGNRTPTYTSGNARAQVQALQWRDLQQLEGLNLNGTRRKIYLFGVSQAVVRSLEKGGDLITRQDGSVWLVAMVLEQWQNGDWCSVAATLQNEGT